jgi:hypothetical protein
MASLRPRFAYEHADLAAVAGDLIAQRTLKYPDAVARGTLSAEQAADGLRIMTTIAADWKRHRDLILHGLPAAIGAEAEAATSAERIATLEQAAQRARQIAASKPADADRAYYADCVETLLWWERQPFGGIRFITDTNLALRAQHAPAVAEAA